MTSLPNCPFCNSVPEWASRAHRRKSGAWLLHCSNDGCLAHHYEQDERGGYNHSFQSEEEAIAAWSTRGLNNRESVAEYPCVPTPFETMMGTVMICKKCGHGYDKPTDCLINQTPHA